MLETEMSDVYPREDRSQVKRVPKRGHYDHETVHAVIDAAWMGHVGIKSPAGGVTVIPMLHARIGNALIFHGANSSRLMKYLAANEPVCVSFAIADGLVLAKSLFHHSMNYRSAVVFGRGQHVEGKNEKLAAIQAISDKLLPGRWEDARFPTDKELAATAVVKLEIETASAKIRTGDPIEDEADVSLDHWSGVLPIQQSFGEPITAPDSLGIPMPEYLRVKKS